STSTPATTSWRRNRLLISGPGPSFWRRPGFLRGGRLEMAFMRPPYWKQRPLNRGSGPGIIDGGRQKLLPATVSQTEATKHNQRPPYWKRGPSNQFAGLHYLKRVFLHKNSILPLLFS